MLIRRFPDLSWGHRFDIFLSNVMLVGLQIAKGVEGWVAIHTWRNITFALSSA